MTPFKKIEVVGKYPSIKGSENIRKQLDILIAHLQKKDVDIVLENKTQQQFNFENFISMTLEDISKNVDLAVVVGGDGTMLGVARSLVDSGIPLIGVNQGRFGFLADLNSENMINHLDLILQGDYVEDQRILLQTNIIRDNKEIYDSFALYDVVIKS